MNTMAQVPSREVCALRKLGIAGVLLCAALALHVTDEALTGFLAVYNPTVVALRERLGYWPMPIFRIQGLAAHGLDHRSGCVVHAFSRGISRAPLDSTHFLLFRDPDASQRARAYSVHNSGADCQLCSFSAPGAGILFLAVLADRLDLCADPIAAHTNALELRASDVGEGGFLPLVGGEIPVAGSGFVVVSAGAVGDGVERQ